MPTFQSDKYNNYYKRILQINQGSNTGIDATTRNIQSGDGTNTLASISDDKLLLQPVNDNTTSTLRISDSSSNHVLNVDTTNKKVIAKENQCCARIMGPRYSDLRCTIISQSGSDYCKKHLHRIDQYGYLAFGRFDQDRPIINEKGNKIPWRDSSSIEDIDTIIQNQLMNLKKIIQ